MHKLKQHVALVIAIVVCIASSTSSARAAYEVYVTVHGTKQGQFGQGRIRCEQFQYQGGDQQTSAGQSSGRRMHDHIVIVKRIDAASPQFARAAATGEVLREVSVEFVHPLPDGREQVYKTLRIANAIITSVRVLDAGSKDASRREENSA